MGDFPTSVGIMLPARWDTQYGGPNLPDQHVTLIYLGEFEDINFDKSDIFDALSSISFNVFVWAEITGREMFGDNQDIPVLTVENPFLQQLRTVVEGSLDRVGIHNASSFKEFKPHITVNREIWMNPPDRAILFPAQLWWGDERINLDQ